MLNIEEIERYHQGVLVRKRSPYMDWPAHVHMETLAKCNAACTFCPYPQLDRQGAKMSDELVAKIIGDLQEIPSTLPFQLSPFKVNEPFMDVRLFDILDTVNTKLPNAYITLTTNASPLTPANLEKLKKVPRLGYLWISFNDPRQKEYEKIMDLPFTRTIERLCMLHQSKQSGELPFRVILSRVGDGSVADDEFLHWVKQHYPAFEVSIFPRGGWIGQVDTEGLAPIPDVGCARWFEISITAPGVVAHCCMDGQAKYPIGDVNTHSVLDIYNAPEYRALCEQALTRMEVSPCNQGSFM